MLDYDIQSCTRRCAVSGRDLLPGEVCYSAILAAGGHVERRDYAPECWQGPPEGALGWWKARLAARENKKAKLAPSDVLLKLLSELESRPDQSDMRYVLALLLVRRRVLRVEDDSNAAGDEELTLHSPRENATYRVRVALPSEERAEEIQRELTGLLSAECSPQAECSPHAPHEDASRGA